jgi:hypothetical protein
LKKDLFCKSFLIFDVLQVSIINFTVTQQGLEEQLLNVVVGHEMAKLEAQRLELVDEVSNFDDYPN